MFLLCCFPFQALIQIVLVLRLLRHVRCVHREPRPLQLEPHPLPHAQRVPREIFPIMDLQNAHLVHQGRYRRMPERVLVFFALLAHSLHILGRRAPTAEEAHTLM